MFAIPALPEDNFIEGLAAIGDGDWWLSAIHKQGKWIYYILNQEVLDTFLQYIHARFLSPD